jgi:adenylate cyclase
MKRRLAAILAADVVGYSRLMSADEAGTLKRVISLRKKVAEPNITRRSGRIVKLMGDGLLGEFPSVVEAVNCAIDMQRATEAAEPEVGEDRRIRLRIGINLGDIIVTDADIYGDGVNIAARLESVAEAGGLCISQAAYEQVKDRVDLFFEDMGDLKLKNIDRPIRAWSASEISSRGLKSLPSRTKELPIPDKPSIAVLPFTTLSQDEEQDHIAVGIAEDIISALSKIPKLLVVSRNSTFVYKDRAVDVKQVSAEQGVRYVLEGSVQKVGHRVRIAAQLIDATSGFHLWSERYDREFDDIFALQDEITLRIATELQVELLEGEMARLNASGTENVEAWTYQIRAVECAHAVSKESFSRARQLAQRAVELDPQYASPMATLAFISASEGRFGWARSRDESLALARSFATQALVIDTSNPEAKAVLGLVALYELRHDEAVSLISDALELSPNHADLAAYCAIAHSWNCEPNKSTGYIERAIRLSPFHPHWYLGQYGFGLRLLGNYEEAVEVFRECGKRQPGAGHIDLAIVYMELGQTDAARREVEAQLRHRPNFKISRWEQTQLYRDPAYLERDCNSLRSAGFPQ